METTPFLTLKKNQTNFEQMVVTSTVSCANFIRQFYSDDIGIFESFFILLLNAQHKTIGYAKISQGGVMGTVVDLKIICKYAVDSLAAGVVVAHNHPSGTLRASDADIQTTKKIKECLKMFDVMLVDHIILTEESFLSFAQEQIL